jgi:hypothetical protein
MYVLNKLTLLVVILAIFLQNILAKGQTKISKKDDKTAPSHGGTVKKSRAP